MRTYEDKGWDAVQSLFPKPSKNGKCQPCNVKYWLWMFNNWALEFKTKAGKKLTESRLDPDYHMVSGRCDCHGNNPVMVMSKNGHRPLQGPGPVNTFVAKTGDPWTANEPRNRQLYWSLTDEQIELLKLDGEDLYVEVDGVDLRLRKKTVASGRYLKGFVRVDDDLKPLHYCLPCPTN